MTILVYVFVTLLLCRPSIAHVHVLIVGIEGAGHHALCNGLLANTPEITTVEWAPDIFLQQWDIPQADPHILQKAILDNWPDADTPVFHCANSFPMGLSTDNNERILRHPDVDAFLNMPDVDTFAIFIQRDILEATESTMRRFYPTREVLKEAQFSRTNQRIVDRYRKNCKNRYPGKCIDVQYQEICNSGEAVAARITAWSGLRISNVDDFSCGLHTGLVPMTNAQRITLITSYWVESEEPGVESHGHRAEIEAAIAINSQECAFQEVVVWLDSVTEKYNCVHFLERINHKKQLINKNLVCEPTLTCVDRTENQPTYYEMFDFSKRLYRDRLVLLANADQVFDSSAMLLTALRPRNMVTISTAGLGNNERKTPDNIRNNYKLLTGAQSLQGVENHCFAKNDSRKRLGWDAYAFFPSDIEIYSVDFKDTATDQFFYMNEIGAENSALNALLKHSQVVGHQVCDAINAWHFHIQEKTHKNGDFRISHNYSFFQDCASELSFESCISNYD